MMAKLRMVDVRYSLSPSSNESMTKITVLGKIINDDKVVVKLACVKITVFDENNREIKSWTSDLKSGYIVAGDSLEFESTNEIPKLEYKIKVDVSLL
jgi:hypothetical protein